MKIEGIRIIATGCFSQDIRIETTDGYPIEGVQSVQWNGSVRKLSTAILEVFAPEVNINISGKDVKYKVGED